MPASAEGLPIGVGSRSPCMVYLWAFILYTGVAHGVDDSRFTSAGLTVCEKRTVVTFENFIQHWAHNVLIYHGLIGLWAEYQVEGIFARASQIDEAQAAGGRCSLYGEFGATRTTSGDNYRGVVLNLSVRPAPAT